VAASYNGQTTRASNRAATEYMETFFKLQKVLQLHTLPKLQSSVTLTCKATPILCWNRNEHSVHISCCFMSSQAPAYHFSHTPHVHLLLPASLQSGYIPLPVLELKGIQLCEPENNIAQKTSNNFSSPSCCETWARWEGPPTAQTLKTWTDRERKPWT